MTLQEMKELLTMYEDAYYNQGTPLVSDSEYDALLKSYLDLSGQQYIDYVPGSINSKKKRIKHSEPVISLAKVQVTDVDEIKSELERLWPVCIQWKLDGATLVLYDKDNSTIAVSRGDGEYGEDKTKYIKYFKNLGDFSCIQKYPIRGEAVIKRKDFKAINSKLIEEGEEPFDNARNALSGMLNRKIEQGNEPEGLSFIAYDFLGVNGNAKTTLDTLESNNWETVHTYYPKSIEDALEYITTFNYYDEELDVDIDGLVIKSLQDKDFGRTEHHPLNAFAVKPETPKVWTRLLNVVWTVGKTGLVVPNAIFEPVDILGSTIEKATLHNKAYMDAIGLNSYIHSDSAVLVTKNNMIIPGILDFCDHKEEFFKGIKTITGCAKAINSCPDCGTTLEQVNDQLYCRNPYCKSKIIAQADNMFSRNGLNIEGLSTETCIKLYDYFSAKFPDYYIESPALFLSVTKKELLELEGFADKKASNLIKEIDKAINSTLFSKFLYSCNIPLLGKKASKLIAKYFKSVDELKEDIMGTQQKILAINGIGKELTNNIYNHFDIIETLSNIINIEYEYKEVKQLDKKEQKTFVITGELSKPRKYYEELIESAGHKLSGSVSKKTSYLVCNQPEESTKYKKALELNITIINEEELNNILNNKGE